MNNIPLARLIEGIIATLRSNVIPHVGDAYARGQAVGVIDLLNNLKPRIDWEPEKLEASLAAKRALLAEVAGLVPGMADAPAAPPETSGEGRRLAERSRLDAAICGVAARLWESRDAPSAVAALALIRAHLHDEAANEMKTTLKPLFAEIASGKSG